MLKPIFLSRQSKLKTLLCCAGLVLALALPASASAWVREAAPLQNVSIFQPESTMTVLPDGSVHYLALGAPGALQTNQLVVRPAAGPAAFAAPFPPAFGQSSGLGGFLSLSPADSAGNQLVLRGSSPFGVAFLAPGADPAAAVVEPVGQITAIGVAPSGEAAAIVSSNSEAFVSFRAAGPGGRFDTPRKLDRAGNMRSYAVGITIDPDGGVFVVYRTEQGAAVLQAYAPPGENFGAPQLVDVAAADIGSLRFGQSTNGRAILTWDEDTGGDTNSEKVWAATREPGGLLGTKSLVATARPGGLVTAHAAAITDDGSGYVAFLDSGTIVCPNNYREGGSVLAQKTGAEWVKLNAPSSGERHDTIEAISTVGNAIGVLTLRTTDPTDKCTDKDPSSALDVQLGQGGSLGAAQTVASESIVSGGSSTIVRPRGFAVNAAGAAALLVDEPLDPSNKSAPFLYYEAAGAVPVPVPPPSPDPAKPILSPQPAPKPVLPAPGKIVISGNKLVAKGGEIPFEASCQRLPGEGNKLFCSIAAILIEQEKRKGKAPTAGTSAKGKAAKPKVLATAKTVQVPVGKTGALALKLNGLGKARLAAAKGGLKATLRVTIARSGYATDTIERDIKVVAGKAKTGGKKLR